MTEEQSAAIAAALARIADSLEALSPPGKLVGPVLTDADAYHWDATESYLLPVRKVSRVPLELLRGIDDVRDILLDNTLRFARGFAANNALLWGAKGMGKSSVVKAVHAHINALAEGGTKRLILIEIAREDIESLPKLMRLIANEDARFIIFCDDLSFDKDETSYKSLKTILDGGLEGRPENVLFYATSNRRHLMARDMVENERAPRIIDHSMARARSVSSSISSPYWSQLWKPSHRPNLSESETFSSMASPGEIAVARSFSTMSRAIRWRRFEVA